MLRVIQAARAVASVRQLDRKYNILRNFWKRIICFLSLLSFRMKKCLFCKIKWLVVIPRPALHESFHCCPRQGLHELATFSTQMLGSKSKSVLCKAPTRDIWHRGSAGISIIVVVATRDLGHNANLLCQYGPWKSQLSGHCEMTGQVVPLRDSPRKKGRLYSSSCLP